MTNKYLYFTDYFFTIFLVNIDKYFKKSYSQRYGSAFSFILIILLTLSFGLSVVYFSYRKNVSTIEEISRLLASKEYKTDNHQEQLFRLRHILNKQNSLADRIYFFPSWAAQVNKSLDKAIESNIKSNLIPALVIFLENALTRTLHNGEITALLEAFKVYLMIAQLEPFDRKCVKEWYLRRVDRISLLSGIGRDSLIESLTNLDIKTFRKAKINKDLQIRILNLFESSSLAKVIYNYGVSQLNSKPDLSPLIILPRSFLDILSKDLINTTIPYAYTKEGYQEYSSYSMRILKEVTGITYLNNTLTSNKLRDSLQEANSLYISDYAANWNDFLLKIQFRSASNLQEALHIIKKIQSSTPLIFKFLEQIDKEISVLNSKIPSPSLQNSVLEKLNTISLDGLRGSNSDYYLEDELIGYRPLDKASITAIQEKLLGGTSELIEFLSSLTIREDLNAASFELAKKIEGLEESPIMKIEKMFHTLPSPLDSTFNALISNIKKLLYQYASNHINHYWEAVIYGFYIEKLQNKYPINPSNYNNQVLVKDFMTFFGKGGLLDNFTSQYLGLKGIILNKQTEELLKFAELVKKYWFNEEGQPQVQFTITPIRMGGSLNKIIISMLGTEITFTRKNLEPASFVWPGKMLSAEIESARINFIDEKLKKTLIYYTGSWAWYRFLELDNYNYVLSKSSSINNIIKSPLGDFEFSVTFNDKLPLLDEKNFFVPMRVVEVISNRIKIYE